MLITLIGGHGKVALLTAPLLTGSGHTVRSVVRTEDHREDVEATGAECVVADVENLSTEELTDLVTGSDAVIWSAGAGGGNPDRTYAVDRDAAIRAIDAASTAGVGRFIMVSYAGSGRDNVPRENPFHHYATAKAVADDHLRGSSLQWTILAPGRLTDEEASLSFEVGDHVLEGDTSRANVAQFIAAALPRTALAGMTLRFRDGSIALPDVMVNLERAGTGTQVARIREGGDLVT